MGLLYSLFLSVIFSWLFFAAAAAAAADTSSTQITNCQANDSGLVMTSSPLSHLSAESAVEVTHFYGLFSVMQGEAYREYKFGQTAIIKLYSMIGLPLSHVILGDSENVVALYRESLVGLGRLAATIHSTAPT